MLNALLIPFEVMCFGCLSQQCPGMPNLSQIIIKSRGSLLPFKFFKILCAKLYGAKLYDEITCMDRMLVGDSLNKLSTKLYIFV